MAVQYTGNTLTGVVVSGSGDTWFTREGYYVASDADGFDAVDLDNLEYFLDGDIFAGDDGIVATSGSNNFDVVIGANASVNAGGDGIQFLGNSLSDTGHDIVNYGSITGSGGEGVDVRASLSSLTNHGAITASSVGVYFSGEGNRVINYGEMTSHNTYAAWLVGDNAQLVNYGTITGGQGVDAIIVSGDDTEVVNAGTVIGTIGLSIGNVDTVAIARNTGSIIAQEIGVELNGNIGAAVLDFSNSGEIRVAIGGLAIEADETTNLIYNTGIIEGRIELGDGNDVYDGRGGTLIGVVDGGGGADTYWVDDSTTEVFESPGGGVDTVYASVGFALGGFIENLTLVGATDLDGAGNSSQNIVNGNVADNYISGDGSRDTLSGGSGSDTVDGGRGDDVLNGDAGDDILLGRAGVDIMDGGEGDDFLFGGVGGDIMLGNDGNDTLKGGLGSDTMTGGDGQDIFVFSRVSDSPSGGSDVILDFTPGTDVLDFSGMLSGVFDLSILGPYSGTGPSIRTSVNTSGDTIVFVDADGDGGTDMRIELDQVTGVTESDFLL